MFTAVTVPVKGALSVAPSRLIWACFKDCSASVTLAWAMAMSVVRARSGQLGQIGLCLVNARLGHRQVIRRVGVLDFGQALFGRGDLGLRCRQIARADRARNLGQTRPGRIDLRLGGLLVGDRWSGLHFRQVRLGAGDPCLRALHRLLRPRPGPRVWPARWPWPGSPPPN